MTTYIKYVSIIEYDTGRRELKLRKEDTSGKGVMFPTPDNDVEEFREVTWERLSVHDLPREMSKGGFKAWWNKHKDDEVPPSPIPEVIEGLSLDE